MALARRALFTRTRILAGALLFVALTMGPVRAQGGDYESDEIRNAVIAYNQAYRDFAQSGDESKLAEMTSLLAKIEAADSDADIERALRDIDANATLTHVLRRGAGVGKVYEHLFRRASTPASKPDVDLDAILEKVRAIVFDDDGLFSKLITDQRFARQVLLTEYKDLAVPVLLDVMATKYREEKGDQAIVHITLAQLAIEEMRSAATGVLLAALDSGDAQARREILRALAAIKDPAALPYLALHAGEAESDDIARATAASGVAQIQGLFPGFAGGTFTELGYRYLERNELLVDIFRMSTTARVWYMKSEGENLSAKLSFRSVPQALLQYAFAKECFYRALDLDPSDSAALRGLALSYVGTQAAGAGDETIADQLQRSSVPLRILGVDTLDAALSWALERKEYGIAERMILELGSIMDSGAVQRATSLLAALGHSDKRISYAAALALAPELEAEGVPSAEVIAKLKAAVGEQSLWVVHLVDSNKARMASFAEGLMQSGGVFVRTHDSALNAALDLTRSEAGDAVVFFEGDQDISMREFFQVLDRGGVGERMALGIIAASEESASKLGESYKNQEIWAAPDPSELRAALLEKLQGSMDRERLRANEFARRAAIALRDLSSRASALSGVTDALSNVIADPSRPADTVLPAVQALGRIGDKDAIAALLDIFTGAKIAADADDDMKSELRLAAGRALARITDRSGGSLAAEQVEAVEGIVIEHSDLGLEAAAILGNASLDAESRRALLIETRENITGGGAP